MSEPVILHRTTAPAGESCECGTRFTAGEACYSYDIGGGQAFACVSCRREAERIGMAYVAEPLHLFVTCESESAAQARGSK